MEFEIVVTLLEAFNGYDGDPEKTIATGGVLVAVAMSVLKSDRIWLPFGMESDVFSLIPGRYRSFVPLVVGGLLGLVNGLYAPVIGVWQDVLFGAIALGGGNQIAYHQLKGLAPGQFVEKLLKTTIKNKVNNKKGASSR